MNFFLLQHQKCTVAMIIVVRSRKLDSDYFTLDGYSLYNQANEGQHCNTIFLRTRTALHHTLKINYCRFP